MLKIASVVLRGILLLLGAVVLGLSVTLAKHQLYGSVPSETGFSSFAGAFGIIASALGLAAIYLESFPLVVSLVADGLSAAFYVAGGVALVIALKGVSCSDESSISWQDRYLSKLLNGGCSGSTCGVDWIANSDRINNELKGRCSRVQVDYSFEFIACAFGIGVLALAYFTSKRSGRAVYA